MEKYTNYTKYTKNIPKYLHEINIDCKNQNCEEIGQSRCKILSTVKSIGLRYWFLIKGDGTCNHYTSFTFLVVTFRSIYELFLLQYIGCSRSQPLLLKLCQHVWKFLSPSIDTSSFDMKIWKKIWKQTYYKS